eukprot:288648_1
MLPIQTIRINQDMDILHTIIINSNYMMLASPRKKRKIDDVSPTITNNNYNAIPPKIFDFYTTNNCLTNQDCETLKQKNEDLQKKLDAMNGYAHEIERYDLEQLNELQKKLKDSLKNVEEAKELYIEKRYFCMVCRENQKNVLLNGCVGNHVVICRECVGKLSEQKCPFCRSDFSRFISFKL